ncbi:MAG TPA: hypothetical protein VK638_31090 [Edaphobacter sp.]|nr:hypothetical protein [Edaphobacter sp.]
MRGLSPIHFRQFGELRVLRAAGGGGTYVVRSDSGSHRRSQVVPGADYREVAFADPEAGWFVSDNGRNPEDQLLVF